MAVLYIVGLIVDDDYYKGISSVEVPFQERVTLVRASRTIFLTNLISGR